MSKRDDWVKVKAESELAPGMLVRLAPVDGCQGDALLLVEDPKGQRVVVRTVSSCCDDMSPGSHALKAALVIQEGRLYRLPDHTRETDASDGAGMPRELVTSERTGR